MASQLPEDLSRAFLDEMQALESFRVSYTSVHEAASIEREDPEVRRLIEALAFLTARTRTAALRGLLATQRRLFQQYFSFLLSPSPAMGLLQAQPTGQLADSALLPRGTQVAVTSDGGPPAIFLTESDLRILPIRLDSLETLLRPRAGTRVVLTFRAAFPRSDELGTLPFHVNHLDDYAASLTVHYQLQKHLEQASIVWNEKATESSEGVRCDVSFGRAEDPEANDAQHPFDRIRGFFHFPQRDLFLNVKVPESPRNWKQFSLCLDLGAGWPRGLRLNKDVFQPFTVPVSNARRASASPILCDGRESRYRIRHPQPGEKCTLHSVLGVYEVLPKGQQPLRPGIVSAGGGSYEIERSVDDAQGESHWIRIRYPEAFTAPKKIAIDALWIQPWFSEDVGGRLAAKLHGRSVPGATFELRGEVRPHAGNRLQDDFEGMLQVLSLKSKAGALTLEELGVLVGALGSVDQGHYRRLREWLGELHVASIPQPRELGGGQRHVYRFQLAEIDPSFLPLVETGLAQLASALRTWTPDASVTVEAVVHGTGAVLTFR